MDNAYPKRAVASFNGPMGLSITADGRKLFVADTGNNAIRLLYIGLPQDYTKVKVSTSVGVAPTASGSSNTAGYNGDGVAAMFAVINAPQGVWVDQNENLYFADTANNLIHVVTNSSYRNFTTGTGARGKKTTQNGYFMTLVAGSNGSLSIPGWNLCAATGGKAAIADTLQLPAGVAVDYLGNIIIADTSSNQVPPLTSPTSPTLATPHNSSPPFN